ncbi:MAG: YIP1 family protein [Gammaproteobacteria bacterium]|nr:YIP1 family protein [Gammaproteobacteria bacterium]
MSETSTTSDDARDAPNTWELLRKIFFRPSEVFAAQKSQPKWGRILLLLVAISLLSTELPDFSSSLQVMINGSTEVGSAFFKHPSLIKGEQYEIEFSTGFMFVLTLFGFLLILFIEALYLRVVSAMLGLELKLDQWMAIVAWSRVPAETLILLVTVVLVLTLFVSNGLLGHEPPILKALLDGSSFSDSAVSYILDLWMLPEIWVIALQTLAFRNCSGKSILFSFAIVVVPFILFTVFGWWLAIEFG